MPASTDRTDLVLPHTLTGARLRALAGGIAATGPAADVEAPFTGALLTRHASSTTADVDAAADRARSAAGRWAATPVRERARVLLRLHDLLLDEIDPLLDLVQAVTGKARGHALEELLDVVNVCRYYARTGPRTLAPHRRAGAIPVLTRTTELRHPVGLVGLVTPWNYPLALGVSDALPALLAGNAVLHKPDTRTALVTLAGRELAVAAGLDPDLWQVVVGDGAVVGNRVTDLVDHISFTGSTPTGRVVAARAASRLIGATLELGGKNPMIVAPDADLAAAVAGAVRGSFSSSGQLCMSIERIYVHRSIAETFTRELAAATRDLRVGADYSYAYQMGSLVSADQLERVSAHVDDAVAAGARVLAGGRPLPELGPYFYAPTVLADVPPTARAYRSETFGPVVSVYPVDSLDDAVRAANDSELGLNASVWSRDTRRARALAARLRAGSVNVNEAYTAAWGSMDAPSGGWGDSGLGRRHGTAGLHEVTWAQTVAHQRVWPIGEHGPLTGRRYQGVMTTALRALRVVGRR